MSKEELQKMIYKTTSYIVLNVIPENMSDDDFVKYSKELKKWCQNNITEFEKRNQINQLVQFLKRIV